MGVESSGKGGCMSRVLLTVVALSALTAAGIAQQPLPLRFEVASIKPWRPPTTPLTSISVAAPAPGSDRFTRTNTTVAALVAYAYDVGDHQLSGGPDWVRTERYEVQARAGRQVSTTDVRAMVKTLLEDRFALRVRTETREMPIFELRLARADGRVGPNLEDCANDKQGISGPEKMFRAPSNGSVATADCAGGNGLTYLVTLASRQLQATVVDKTGLTGAWRFHVYYASQLPAFLGGQAQANPDLASFGVAIQEQLGVKLERTRGPVPVVVIESVERPTPD
jgi:uncharacterized protein (TIGR03435 family)